MDTNIQALIKTYLKVGLTAKVRARAELVFSVFPRGQSTFLRESDVILIVLLPNVRPFMLSLSTFSDFSKNDSINEKKFRKYSTNYKVDRLKLHRERLSNQTPTRFSSRSRVLCDALLSFFVRATSAKIEKCYQNSEIRVFEKVIAFSRRFEKRTDIRKVMW